MVNMKMHYMKLTDQFAGHKIAGQENNRDFVMSCNFLRSVIFMSVIFSHPKHLPGAAKLSSP